MIVKPTRLMFAMIAMAAAPAFAQNVATVNGKPIPASRVDQVVKQFVAQGKGTDSPQLRDAIKKDLISREVLIQEADKQGIGARPDVKNQIENARQSIIINAMLGDYIKKHPVSDAEVKAAYDQYKAQLGDKEYHARHILIAVPKGSTPAVDAAAKAKAEGIIADLRKNPNDFEKLAKAQSADKGSAEQGGDLDWSSAARYVPEFSKALTSLQKGQLTDAPVRTEFGWHVIKLDDVRATKFPSLDEVKQQASSSLQQNKIEAYREELLKKAKIQ
jgi:peptidyl-prolyl cis-trans isomerase C